MATAYVADVKAMLSIYKFCASVPLQYVITRFTSYSQWEYEFDNIELWIEQN